MSASSPTTPLPPHARLTGVLLFLFFLALFGLTGSKLYFGYEGQNVDQAEALVAGTLAPRAGGGIEPYAKTGVLEVAAYVPFAALKQALHARQILWGFHSLAYVMVNPLLTALLCLAFYGLVLRLYRRPATAAALTLILGLTTLIAPYSKFGMETQQTLWTVTALWALTGWVERPTAGRAAWLGGALAALMLTKVSGLVHAGVILMAAGWLTLTHELWRRNGFLRGVLWMLGLTAAGFGMLLATNRWRYGGWLFQGRYSLDAEMWPMPLWEGLWAFLASPNKSVFLFSPPLLIALWYGRRFWQRFPVMRIVLVLFGLLTLKYLMARTWADECWGARRMHFLIPLALLPLGLWWEERRRLAGWLRRTGWVVLGLGLTVQGIGMLFDYTAQAKSMGHTPVYAQEHYLWDPQFNHLRFNLHLLDSWNHRQTTGRSLPFFYELHYLPVTRPATVPPAIPFSVEGLDRLDLWSVQQQEDWPGQPYWFRSPSSWVVVALGLIALGTLGALVRLIERAEMDDGDAQTID